MALKKLVGLAALGGFLYAHKKRGGTLTMDSFRETARGLFSDLKMKAQDLKAQAEQKLHDRSAGDIESASATGKVSDVTGYGSAGYGYGSGSSSGNDFRR